MTSNRQAIIDFVRATLVADEVGNLPPLPGVFPDYPAPIARNRDGQRELSTARWGMPKPAFAVKGAANSGVTNIRNTKSAHWRRWLGVEDRCQVPFTSFSENEALPDGTHPPVWFALDDSRPLAFWGEAQGLQRPLPVGALQIVARGGRSVPGRRQFRRVVRTTT